jgi:hypothetical protein
MAEAPTPVHPPPRQVDPVPEPDMVMPADPGDDDGRNGVRVSTASGTKAVGSSLTPTVATIALLLRVP